MERVKAILGYFAAGLTILAAILTPFVLMPLFVKAVGAMGIRPAATFSGGKVARTIDRGGYRIEIHVPVEHATPFQRMEPFVQVDWSPASGLPERVQEELDLDGDGRPDLAVSFAVPKDPKAPLSAAVQSPSGTLIPVACLKKDSFYCLIVRAGDKIILRIPFSKGHAPSKR